MANELANIIFVRSGVPQLKKYLDLSTLNHKLTSGNIANSSTPGYKSRSIDFQKEFDKATSQTNHLAGKLTDEHHIVLGQHQDRAPEVKKARIHSGDLNSVNIDAEMADIAKSELQFSAAAKILQLKFQGLRKAITSK